MLIPASLLVATVRTQNPPSDQDLASAKQLWVNCTAPDHWPLDFRWYRNEIRCPVSGRGRLTGPPAQRNGISKKLGDARRWRVCSGTTALCWQQGVRGMRIRCGVASWFEFSAPNIASRKTDSAPVKVTRNRQPRRASLDISIIGTAPPARRLFRLDHAIHLVQPQSGRPCGFLRRSNGTHWEMRKP